MAYSGTNNRNNYNGGNRRPYNNNRDRDQAPRKPKIVTVIRLLASLRSRPSLSVSLTSILFPIVSMVPLK